MIVNVLNVLMVTILMQMALNVMRVWRVLRNVLPLRLFLVLGGIIMIRKRIYVGNVLIVIVRYVLPKVNVISAIRHTF